MTEKLIKKTMWKQEKKRVLSGKIIGWFSREFFIRFRWNFKVEKDAKGRWKGFRVCLVFCCFKKGFLSMVYKEKISLNMLAFLGENMIKKVENQSLLCRKKKTKMRWEIRLIFLLKSLSERGWNSPEARKYWKKPQKTTFFKKMRKKRKKSRKFRKNSIKFKQFWKNYDDF